MNRYIVSYDVSDPKRLRRVFKTMQGFGFHIQLSVFLCDLSPKQKVMLVRSLTEVIHDREDHVLIFDIGPSDGRGKDCFQSLGRQLELPDKRAIIV